MELKKIDNPDQPYVEALRPIDEKILALLAERKQLAGSKPGIPPWKLVGEWAKRFELDEDWLYRLLTNMTYHDVFRRYKEPERLRTVIPILKRTEAQDCLFEITHMMQYEKSSVVFLEVRYLPEIRANFEMHQTLALTISQSGQQSQSRRMHGGGTHMHYEFTFAPSLPDDLSGIQFCIQKGEHTPRHLPIIRIELSEPILFEE